MRGWRWIVRGWIRGCLRYPGREIRAAAGAVLVSLLALALAACDDRGLQGPGALMARVDAPEVELGSAVVEVTGTGIRGFEAVGGSRVLTRSAAGSHRVVVVDPEGGDLRFRIQVEDVAATLPAAVVQSAADTANALVASGVSLTVGRDR